jgi:hypothetical protein
MKQILIIIGLTISGLAFGQDSKTTDFLTEIQNYEISDLWTLDKFQPEDDTAYIKRQEPLGYIGENYQRLYIHLISVIRNPTNKLEYYVYGKTMVKDNICSFQGLITIKEARTFIEGDLPPLKQGFVKGDYIFYEDSKQKETGTFTGNFQTNFYIDKNGIIKYDALMFVADGFENNQFEGLWTSYQTKNSKKCNWGDYRIPDSKGLDDGVAKFIPNEKYYSSDWLGYMLEHNATQNIVTQSGDKENNKYWWKDN